MEPTATFMLSRIVGAMSFPCTGAAKAGGLFDWAVAGDGFIGRADAADCAADGGSVGAAANGCSASA